MSKQANQKGPKTNIYDQGSRYVAKLNPLQVFSFFMNLARAAFGFHDWLDTRRVPYHGKPDQTCDTIGWLEDLESGSGNWAVVLEFAITPKGITFGRLLGYLASLWEELQTGQYRRRRFQVGAIVVNLTGRGRISRTMAWPGMAVSLSVRVCEVNLAYQSAYETMEGIESGKRGRGILPFIPLMQGGLNQISLKYGRRKPFGSPTQDSGRNMGACPADVGSG